MSVNVPTLDRVRSLEQLYRSGYRSATVDATIDKVLSVEIAKAKEEAENLHARLVELEAAYGVPSAEAIRRFHAGEMGDSADMFERSAFYQMWLSAQERIRLLSTFAAVDSTPSAPDQPAPTRRRPSAWSPAAPAGCPGAR